MKDYMLTMHTQHNRTSQDITYSSDLQRLKDTADSMKNKLHKDETITITDMATGEIMHMVER